jgi:DHA1 family bicyclomycin/chloramphenicol resistance-like MFS transporter
MSPSQPGAAAPPASRRTLLLTLLGQMAFGLLAMTICIPSMQEWGAQFGVAQPAVQLTFSGFVVTYGGLQLVYGPWSDRLGRRAVLMAGLALAVVASFLAALAPSIGWLTAARVLQGAGAAAGMVVGRAMVQDEFQGPERTRVMAYVGMAMGLCPPLATVLGGQIHVWLGWQANFWLMGGLGLLLLGMAWRGLPARGGTATAGSPGAARSGWWRSLLQSYAKLWHEPAFRWVVLMLSSATAAFYAFLAGTPLVLRSYGLGPDRIGFVIMCVPLSYIAGSFATTRLARHRSGRWLMRAGQAFTLGGLSLLVLLAVAGVQSVAAFAMPLMLLGVGHGLMVPPALATSVGLVPALAGAAAAVVGLMQQLIGAVGGYVVGLLPQASVAHLGALMLGISVMGALAQRMLHRRMSTVN